MAVKESSFERMTGDTVPAEKRTRLENFFTVGLRDLGIHPRDILVEGPTVRIFEEFRAGREFRVPADVLSSGISVLLQEAGKRKRMADWPFFRQIGYLAWHGRREGGEG